MAMPQVEIESRQNVIGIFSHRLQYVQTHSFIRLGVRWEVHEWLDFLVRVVDHAHKTLGQTQKRHSPKKREAVAPLCDAKRE